MQLKRVLFPQPPRRSPIEHWLNIGLRSAHLVGIAGIGGGFLFDLAEARWLAYWHLTVASGVLLSLLYLWSTAAWLFQVKGLVVILKLGLLAAAMVWPSWRGELFVLVIVISGLVAHAPAYVRGHRLLPIKGPGT